MALLARNQTRRDCRYTLHTLLPDGTAPPFSGLPCRTLARTIKRVFQRAVPSQATAEAAESTITQARPTLVTGDPGARDRPDATDARDRPDATDARVAHLEAEVLKLGGRCRAHEHALECLSRAVLTLRRANRALTEENSILRLELERLRGRAVARTSTRQPALHPRRREISGGPMPRFEMRTISPALATEGRAEE